MNPVDPTAPTGARAASSRRHASAAHDPAAVGVAWVTGASSGIGESVAHRLAERGYTVALIARRESELRRVGGLLVRRDAIIKPVDLADPVDTTFAAEQLVERHGAPNVLINCAGLGVCKPFLDHSPADHDHIMRVNYHAAADLIRIALPGMLERGSGLVVNVASISAKMGPWGHAAYTASKAALIAMTQTLASEHPRSGVNFTYVNPGIVATPYFERADMQPLWRQVRKHAITPDAVAEKIVRLIDRPRLELCVPRHYRVLDWIGALNVGALHRLVSRSSRPLR